MACEAEAQALIAATANRTARALALVAASATLADAEGAYETALREYQAAVTAEERAAAALDACVAGNSFRRAAARGGKRKAVPR